MAVRENDLDPKVYSFFNDCAENKLSIRIFNWYITDSKKIFSIWLFKGKS